MSSSRKRKIYNRLTVLRVDRGLSREELAKELGVNFQTIGYLERGDYTPSLELALMVSKFFELPVEEIFSFEEFEPISKSLGN